MKLAMSQGAIVGPEGVIASWKNGETTIHLPLADADRAMLPGASIDRGAPDDLWWPTDFGLFRLTPEQKERVRDWPLTRTTAKSHAGTIIDGDRADPRILGFLREMNRIAFHELTGGHLPAWPDESPTDG